MVFSDAEPMLTPRETGIVELIANGYSAKEVAAEIHIAPRTVERHIENARHKLRAKNMPHLVIRAVISGALNIESGQA